MARHEKRGRHRARPLQFWDSLGSDLARAFGEQLHPLTRLLSCKGTSLNEAGRHFDSFVRAWHGWWFGVGIHHALHCKHQQSPPPNAALEHAGCFFKGPSEAGEAETRHVHLKHVQAKCRTGHPKPTTVGPGTRITSLCLLAPSYQHDQHWACTSSNCLFSYRTA